MFDIDLDAGVRNRRHIENGAITIDETRTAARSRSWSEFIFAPHKQDRSSLTIGVLEGEGIGVVVVGAALRVLAALTSISDHHFDVRFGGPIGLDAELRFGQSLCGDTIAFCEKVFSDGGAILAGPGGGRFVYDLRKRFDLFCKLSPLRPFEELSGSIRLKPERVRGVDIILVRENVSGIYQGHARELHSESDGKVIEHTFRYSEIEVRRILRVAGQIALRRSGTMTMVIKDGGLPALSDLWRGCADDVASELGVHVIPVNVDLGAYRLIQHAQELDVVVASNLFGDVLADLGGVLLGSRGLSFSGNFSSSGATVYQTNHGAAFDLVGTDRANPAGQIFSLAMLLRESFGLMNEASLIEEAVRETWRRGWRTLDLEESGCSTVGAEQMGNLVAETLVELAETRSR